MPAGARHGHRPLQRRLPPLQQRSLAENLYWGICAKLQRLVKQMDEVPRICRPRRSTVRHVLLQLSLFQSIPDAGPSSSCPVLPTTGWRSGPPHTRCWATSRATRTARSISSSIAATSSGPCRCTPSTACPTTWACSWWRLQEILGDMHNLFGDTHAVHVTLSDRDGVVLDES